VGAVPRWVSWGRDAGADGQARRRVIDELRELGGNILLFGHGHCFRSVAARFLELSIRFATNLRLDAGTISILSYDRDGPALALWNRRVQPGAVVVADIATAIARTVP
jgi:broad specificity phosphatase PhoE